MTAPRNLTQVELELPTTLKGLPGLAVDVVWIDSNFAVKGRRVRDEDGRVWTVTAVYGTRPFAGVEKQHVWKRWAEVLGD